MPRPLLTLVFAFGFAVSAQTVASLPLGPTAAALMPVCDKTKLNHGKPFERVDVLVERDGSIKWNGESVTKERLDSYIKNEVALVAQGHMVFNFIGEENEDSASVLKAQSLRVDARKLDAAVPDCRPIIGPNGHFL